MSSISRACIELSNSIKGFRLNRSPTSETPPGKEAINNNNSNMRTAGNTVTNTITRAIKSATSRVRGTPTSADQSMMNGTTTTAAAAAAAAATANVKNGNTTVNGCETQLVQHTLLNRIPCDNIWEDDDKFLCDFFYYFSPCERCVLAQVCGKWRDLLYKNKYWANVAPVLNCRMWQKDDMGRALFYKSLENREFDTIVITGATDLDITEFVNNFPNCRKDIHSVALRCSNITDTGLENMMEKMLSVCKLELSGCNEITESAFWSCLNARIVSLSISDCINVADDSVGAIAQLLPSLIELNLQAYHVTDTSLSFFSAKQSYSLTILRLYSCWEITNHGLVNIVHSLPNVVVLSLSGCSKVTDDGVELIAEHLRNLKSLDLSWCPRITDAGLEYIACDLGSLEELILDR